MLVIFLLLFFIFFIFPFLNMYIENDLGIKNDNRDILIGIVIILLIIYYIFINKKNIYFFIPQKNIEKNEDINEEIINDNLNKFNIINN